MRTAVSALMFVALASPVLLACPVCGLASASDNQSSYVSMSIMLSVLPLGMIAGFGIWLYRKYR
jgi:hypothetical protein